MHDLLHHELHHVADEWGLPTEHQVGDGPKRIDISPSVDTDLWLHLLGGHEFRCADDPARCRRSIRTDVGHRLADYLCETEIPNLYKSVAALPLLHEKYVGRF